LPSALRSCRAHGSRDRAPVLRPTWKSFLFGIPCGIVTVVGVVFIYTVIFPALHFRVAAEAMAGILKTPFWFRLLLVTRGAVFEEICYCGYLISNRANYRTIGLGLALAGCADFVGGLYPGTPGVPGLGTIGRGRFRRASSHSFICLAARSGRQCNRSLRRRWRGIFCWSKANRGEFSCREGALGFIKLLCEHPRYRGIRLGDAAGGRGVFTWANSFAFRFAGS